MCVNVHEYVCTCGGVRTHMVMREETGAQSQGSSAISFHLVF